MRCKKGWAVGLLGMLCACGASPHAALIPTPEEARGERPEVELVYEAPLSEAFLATTLVLSGRYRIPVGRRSPTELITPRVESVSLAPRTAAWSRYYVQGVDLGGNRSILRIFRTRLHEQGSPSMESRRTEGLERQQMRANSIRNQLEDFLERLELRDRQERSRQTQANTLTRDGAPADPMEALRRQAALVEEATRNFDGMVGTDIEPFSFETGKRELRLEREVTQLLEGAPALEPVGAALPVPVQALVLDERLQVARPEVPRCSEPLPGAADTVAAGTTLLLADPLGTREVPVAAGQLVCAATERGLPVVLGLALPSEEQPHLDAYLASEGTGADLARLLTEGRFWRRAYQDGRSSRAVLGLVEHARALRAAGHRISVLALDAEALEGNAREAHMAERVLEARAAQPGALLVAVVGDVHARTRRGAAWDAKLVPLGARLAEAGLAPVALAAAFQRGTQHVCRFALGTDQVVCRVFGRSPSAADLHPYGAARGLERYAAADADGFHGRVRLGALTASLPVLDVQAARAREARAPPAQ